jgi:mRNA interferase RelE/StbE
MNFILKYETSVVRTDIPKLSSKNKNCIKTTIEEKLVTEPEIFGKPLRKSLKGYRSLRAGDYRVIFRIEDNLVKIFLIEHRSIVYDIATKRR